MKSSEFVFNPKGVKKQSRPKLCPRLTTLPVKKGKCPAGYDAQPSKTDPDETCCKRQVLIPLKRGTLSKFGYAAKDPKSKRHAALKKAVAKHGWLRVFRKLNAVMVYSKNKESLYKKFLADRNWVREQFKPKDVPVKKEVKKEKKVKKEEK